MKKIIIPKRLKPANKIIPKTIKIAVETKKKIMTPILSFRFSAQNIPTSEKSAVRITTTVIMPGIQGLIMVS